jgi:hypothetical protein
MSKDKHTADTTRVRYNGVNVLRCRKDELGRCGRPYLADIMNEIVKGKPVWTSQAKDAE